MSGIHAYNYEALKQLAKQSHRPVSSLIALARQNDPFYVGTEQDKRDGEWFFELWQRFGYTTGVHVRRVHYAVVSANPPVMLPNGKPYENTLQCWKFMNDAAKTARYLGLVDPGAFIDKRNEKPVDNLNYEAKREVDFYISSALEMEAVEIDFPSIPSYRLLTFDSPQRYHLEIWCEKSTMNDVIVPLVEEYEAVLMYGKGELSITMALDAINRFIKSEKPVRIFYVSDFDPAGIGMPVSMARKLEYFIRTLNLDIDVKLYPVVLTAEQVEYYKHQNPPILPTPIKETERRKDKFEKRYGNGDGESVAVELDALEALYPGELEKLLRAELDRYYDHSLRNKVNEAREKAYRTLRSATEDVYARHLSDLNTLIADADEIQQVFDEALAERIASHSQRRYKLSQIIESELEADRPTIEDDEIPQPAIAEEREAALFDSTRDYLSQNDAYQAYKGNATFDEQDIA